MRFNRTAIRSALRNQRGKQEAKDLRGKKKKAHQDHLAFCVRIRDISYAHPSSLLLRLKQVARNKLNGKIGIFRAFRIRPSHHFPSRKTRQLSLRRKAIKKNLKPSGKRRRVAGGRDKSHSNVQSRRGSLACVMLSHWRDAEKIAK